MRERKGVCSDNGEYEQQDRETGRKERQGMDIQIGDVVTLKKQHPCGSKEWEVLRVGMDFRVKCMGCDHQVMIPRKQLEKNIRQIVSKENKAV